VKWGGLVAVQNLTATAIQRKFATVETANIPYLVIVKMTEKKYCLDCEQEINNDHQHFYNIED